MDSIVVEETVKQLLEAEEGPEYFMFEPLFEEDDDDDDDSGWGLN